MEIQYYGVDRGAPLASVVTGSSTTGKKIELAVDLSGNATRAEVLRALEAIKNTILSSASPFAQ